ncbi:MAG: metallophosphoesterase, partial [Candidatus Omnitrophota bacterium]
FENKKEHLAPINPLEVVIYEAENTLMEVNAKRNEGTKRIDDETSEKLNKRYETIALQYLYAGKYPEAGDLFIKIRAWILKEVEKLKKQKGEAENPEVSGKIESFRTWLYQINRYILETDSTRIEELFNAALWLQKTGNTQEASAMAHDALILTEKLNKENNEVVKLMGVRVSALRNYKRKIENFLRDPGKIVEAVDNIKKRGEAIAALEKRRESFDELYAILDRSGTPLTEKFTNFTNAVSSLAEDDFSRKITGKVNSSELEGLFKEPGNMTGEKALKAAFSAPETWKRTQVTELPYADKNVKETCSVKGLDTDDEVIVIPDVHGDLKALRDYLEGLGLIRKGSEEKGGDDVWTGKNVTVVQMGDLIDRGPDSLGCLRYMRGIQKKAEESGTNSKVVRLMGNHEILYLLDAEYDEKDPALDKRRLDAVRINVSRSRRTMNIPENEIPELLKILREDIENNNIVAVYQKGGKMFSHSVITSYIIQDVLGEADAEKANDASYKNQRRAEFEKEVNERLRSAVKNNIFTDPIFNMGKDIDVELEEKAGVFFGYIRNCYLLNRTLGVAQSEFDQVVGHDPLLWDIKAVPIRSGEGSIIGVDVGMSEGFAERGSPCPRKALVFKEGSVFIAEKQQSGAGDIVSDTQQEGRAGRTDDIRERYEKVEKQIDRILAGMIPDVQYLFK